MESILRQLDSDVHPLNTLDVHRQCMTNKYTLKTRIQVEH